jgi:hypothetical protein
MVFGMSLATYTFIHVLISLIGIVTGAVFLYGFLAGTWFKRWTALFLYSTFATTLTGFGFPITQFTPALGTGIVSTGLFGIIFYALYVRRLVGVWEKTFVISAVAAFYLNAFVLVVQSFLKIPALNALAPKQTEPPFAVAQTLVLVFFIWAGFKSVRKLRGPSPGTVNT